MKSFLLFPSSSKYVVVDRICHLFKMLAVSLVQAQSQTCSPLCPLSSLSIAGLATWTAVPSGMCVGITGNPYDQVRAAPSAWVPEHTFHTAEPQPIHKATQHKWKINVCGMILNLKYKLWIIVCNLQDYPMLHTLFVAQYSVMWLFINNRSILSSGCSYFE